MRCDFMEKKQCFLISSIGEEDSDLRVFADKVRAFLKYEVLNDDSCAFLHFCDNQRHIKLTLFIRGQGIVKEFEKMYSEV